MVKLQFIVGAALHATPLVAFPHKGPYFVRVRRGGVVTALTLTSKDPHPE